MPIVQFHDYTIEPLYQQLSSDQCDEVIQMWMEHHALPNPDKARGRVPEVVCLIRHRSGSLVGVSTVHLVRNAAEDATHMHYRMFIRAQDRVSGLMRKVTAVTRMFFDENKDLRGAASAMIICTENPKLMRPGLKRMFSNSVWKFAGKDPRGLDLWRFDFTN